jgi:predicted ferric reductase
MNNSSPQNPQRPAPLLEQTLVILPLALILGGALAIPFFYETQTLWYKAGLNKIMLRTGQMAGLFALILLQAQILLALRPRFGERLFGSATLVRWHKRNGLLIAGAAVAHVLLVVVPEGITNWPVGLKHWPEMVGGALLLLLLVTVLLSQFRVTLRLSYPGWRQWHRPLGYLALALALVHVSYVSESFRHPLPLGALLLVFATVLIAIIKKYTAH